MIPHEEANSPGPWQLPEWEELWQRLRTLEAVVRQLRSERAALEAQLDRLRLTLQERDAEILRLRAELARRLQGPLEPEVWVHLRAELMGFIERLDALLAPPLEASKRRRRVAKKA
ncbi:MAG: hypothetical protein N2561_02390 [Bacteroidetes bacterium]|nr:hypothetical protein [Rhodothermia bacterium]MCS7154651.1 hypothetical protein [Bacteroidota bacterium]MCX7906368.1 hypothetical protein [Bacteroidota bacterium]MDW8137444.1 hypothetical protein [Bacteroidota bacterium]MDW8285602.1 hypothetical protein [Bacteroidota bacterium]